MSFEDQVGDQVKLLSFGITICFQTLLFASPTSVQALPQPKDPSQYQLEIVYTHGDQTRVLKRWTKDDLWAAEWVRTWERAPSERSAMKWQGPRLTTLIQDSIQGLSLEEKSVIDWVVLYNRDGVAAMAPRSFINRFPLTIAMRRGSRLLRPEDQGPIATVVPWTTRPKARQMSLPVEQYFVGGLVRVELTRLSTHFSDGIKLPPSADPVAKRGERLFLKTCMGCHARSSWPQISNLAEELRKQDFSPQSHAPVPQMPRLRPAELKGLESYLDRFQKRSSARTESRTGAGQT
jgi:mono/diheme cytochrome c family protein